MIEPGRLDATDSQSLPDAFTLTRHRDVMIIHASHVLEPMDPTLLEGAASILLDTLRGNKNLQIVFDLGDLNHFGSTFLALLVRCSKLAVSLGGGMVLAGVSKNAKFLLHITSLDMVWPMYGTAREAIEALESE